MSINTINEGMQWGQAIPIINQLIAAINQLNTSIGGAIVEGGIDYAAITNKPTINDVEVAGALSSSDLNLSSGSSGSDEPSLLDRAQTVAESVVTAALANKADAASIQALTQTLATKLTASLTNIRAVFPVKEDAVPLMEKIVSLAGQADSSTDGSQILILSNQSPNAFTLYTFDYAEKTWDDGVKIVLNLNGGGVQQVSVQAVDSDEAGTQIAAITVDGTTYNIYAPPAEGSGYPVDITLDDEASDARVPTSKCVKTALDTKASASSVEDLAETVASLTSELDEKAPASDVSELEDQVGSLADSLASKASASSVSSLQAAVAGKLSINQGATNAGKVPVVGSDGNLTLTDDIGSVKTVTVNGGSPASPDSDGNIDITVAQGNDLEKLKVNGTLQNPDSNGNVDISVVQTIKVNGNIINMDNNGVVNIPIDESSDLESLTLNGTALSPDENGVVNLDVVEAVKLNGTDLEKDAEGKIDIQIEIPEVDSSLDETSTNAVQNAAVATALSELQHPSFNADVEEVEGGQQVTLTTAAGDQVAQFVVTGGGGGGGDNATSKIVLTASVTQTKVKEGGSSTLNWYYNHVNADDVADGINGDITVTVKRGAVTLHEETLTNVSPSEAAHQIVLDPWLTTAGTIGVTIRANANDSGVAQSKQYYVAVNVITLSLLLNNSAAIISKSLSGGYLNSDTIIVGYTLRGNGTKEVCLYIDDNDTPLSNTVTKSGTTNGQFTIAASSLSAGRHVLQLVAENDGLLSESTYIDILKGSVDVPFVGLLFTSDLGTIFGEDDYLTPIISAAQYATSTFDYFVFDPERTIATMQEYRDNAAGQVFTAGRTRQTYSSRYPESGTIAMRYVCGSTQYHFSIEVTASSIDVSKATAGLVLELIAAGRSNDEANPATWTSGAFSTAFSGFDWKSSGWDGESLILRNGAKIDVDYKPFDESTDPATTGKTIEMEFRISNVIDDTADLISCLTGGKGFHVTGSKATLLTGSSVTYNDEDGNSQTRIVGVEKLFATDMDVKLVFVIGKRSQHRLMELYINGTREKADIYNTTDNFVQLSPVGITFDSTAADIELRSIRVYSRALTDDEIVDNFIVDRRNISDMLAKYEENDVLENGEYDITKILSKGKGVVHFTRPKGLDEVNSANNKKTDFLTDLIYYSPFGPEWDLRIDGCNLRIQGTSSTKYPRKNYRIYLLKPSSRTVYRRNTAGSWVQDSSFDGYAYRDTDREAPLICLKADYSDSSMSTNTGGAKLFDALMRQLGLLTPPQEVDSLVRQSIDGFPVDVFCTDSDDETNAVKYYGQYNFNHDKDSSQNIFGHVTLSDEDGDQHTFGDSVCLESLNNTVSLDLFQAAGSEDSDELASQLEEEFDDAFEFNHPKDTLWEDATTAQKTAVKRLMGWIYDCIQQCVDTNGLDPDETDYSDDNLAKFASSKFKSEIGNYFVLEHLLTYYAFTDYFMCVDQRAKNILIRTWDYMHWYFTYYDGDCQLGMRNDSFLAYPYTMDREYWDSDKSKYGFEGHDSWLWCLVLANFSSELADAVRSMRNILTNEAVLTMLNKEQQGNWSERAYNKSGEFKYILPATEGVTVIQDGSTTDGVIYPFIYALNGTNQSHRIYTILHRFALLDAKYGCSSFRADSVEMYVARQSSDPAGTILIKSFSPYYFDWNTKNGSHYDPQKADAGDTVTLTFSGAITVNDPVDLYGASCIEELDLRGVAGSLQNGINLNRATLLREITAASQSVKSQVWFFNFDLCTRLRLIDCTNHVGVKTGTSSSTEFNVSNQTRLEVLRLGGTAIQSVELAEGAPITELILPSTLTVLKLRYLPLLTTAGLTIQGYSSITTLIFAACPGLDWVTIASNCSNLYRLRVEGVDMEDDGTVLQQFKHLRGVDAEGNAVTTCQLVGQVKLTKYIEADTMAELVAAYPELTIIQPDYTMIEFDDTVEDDANVSNLDNRTGYKFGNDYVCSGHILELLNRRHRVLSKVTASGVATIFPLHDANTGKFTDAVKADDCTTASLNGSQGDVMMFEPGRWYKGVNDILGISDPNHKRKHFSCYSSRDINHPPAAPEATVLYYDDISDAGGVVRESYLITTGKATLASSYTSNSSYRVLRVSVEGYSRVRFPSVQGSDFKGAIFVNQEDEVVGSVMVETLSGGFENGMYVIADVPEEATDLYFTVLKTAEFDKVVLSNSPNIEDMEPDWVWDDAFLCGVAETSVTGGMMRSIMKAAASAGSYTWTDFHHYSSMPANSGRQQIDYEMHKSIANLFFAKYGRRDSQKQCGRGSDSSSRNMNGTVTLGMTDTVNPTETTDAGAWYWKPADTPNSQPVLTSINNNNVLGYQDLFGDKYEMMDGVNVNLGSSNGKWTIAMPDGSTRLVKGATATEYIKAVVHGKYMDIIPAGNIAGSASSYYCDYFYYSSSTSRVVYRSCVNADAHGGVSFAYANVDSSSSNTYVGSRLAFRGTIEWAASVAAFLAATELS